MGVRFGKARIIFHGGEPTVVGLDYLKKSVEILGERHYTIQSNLISVDRNLPALLHEHFEGCIGSSFDQGRIPYLDKWLRNVGNLSGRGIKVTVLITVTNALSFGRIENTVNAFERAGGSAFRLQFATPVRSEVVEPSHYADVFSRLFHHPLNESSKRVTDSLCTGFIGINGGNCAEKVRTVNPDGTVYVCPEFAGQGIFPLGHVAGREMRDIPMEFYEREKSLSLECCPDYWQVCRGGCLANAYFVRGDRGKDPYCGLYKLLFSFAEASY